MKDAEYFIDQLKLEPHPEGGYFKEIYRSSESIESNCLPDRYSSDRNFGTSIYYLLKDDQKSHLHRLKSDELWYHQYGGTLEIHLISLKGEYKKLLLGSNFENGEQLQIIIPKGNWFGACLNKEKSFTLVGCAVIPGFDFSDFEMGDREALLNVFPQHEGIIKKLTR